jgi:hypothetical protein
MISFYLLKGERFQRFVMMVQLLLKIADVLFTKTNATLRQQERVFALTRLILCSFKTNQYYIFSPTLCFGVSQNNAE